MMPMQNRGRRGFTIVEIITALVIVSIIGLAMTKLILGQTRAFQFDNGGRRARAAARSAMNILITDLRMTQDNGGVTAVNAANTRVDVRVPVVFGYVCENSGTSVVVSLVPVDSFQRTSAKYGGYAYRDSTTGLYTYVAAAFGDTIQATDVSRCHSGSVGIYADTANISGRRGGVFIASALGVALAPIGAPVFIWQTVSYEFKNSQIYPGRYGLYRTVRGRANTDTTADELIAPFKTTARFYYYSQTPYPTRDTALTTAPALNNIRGFKIFLPAESSDTMPTRNTPISAAVTTAVFFKNTRIP